MSEIPQVLERLEHLRKYYEYLEQYLSEVQDEMLQVVSCLPGQVDADYGSSNVSASFNAVPYLAAATPASLEKQALSWFEYGGSTLDAATFCRPIYGMLSAAIAYANASRESSEVWMDSNDAMDWLAEYRPEVLKPILDDLLKKGMIRPDFIPDYTRKELGYGG